MEQLVGRQWSVWRLTPLLDVPPEVLCAELEAALGLSRRGDGRATVGFVDRSAPEPRLLTIAAELSHAKTRGCVPPGVLPARTPENGGENDDDEDALTERFEAVAVLSPPLPRRRQCRCCALLTAGAERLGAKAVAWIERRFDCYARRLPALPPVQLSRVALRWAVAAAASAADAGSLALSFAAPEGVRGVADVAVELPLSALHAQLLQLQQQQPTEQGVSEALAPVCRRLCGVDTSKLPLVAFSTPDAALTAAAELALFSHAFPLALVLDLARDF